MGREASPNQLMVRQAQGLGSVVFDQIMTYSRNPTARQQAFKDVFKYSATCGLDKAGAKRVELQGGYHAGRCGIDKYGHLTGKVYDASGGRMYFYRLSDKTFWERIHFPRNTPSNASIFCRANDYVPITKAQYCSKEL